MDSDSTMMHTTPIERQYCDLLKGAIRRHDLDSISDIIWVPRLIETLRSSLTIEESNMILNVIASKLCSVFRLFQYELNDRELKLRMRETLRLLFTPMETLRVIDGPPKIICDETNNPPHSVEEGKLMVDVYFKAPAVTRVFHTNISNHNYYVETLNSYKENE